MPFINSVQRFVAVRYRRLWTFVLRLLGRPSLGPVRPYPNPITYHGIPGPSERKKHPDWPEERFQIPKEVPFGTIYYIHKGEFLGCGNVAHVDRTLDGHAVKFPRTNPYYLREEESYREAMRTEAEVYRRLAGCPYLPKLIQWDPESCTMTLELMENRDLASYTLGQNDFDSSPPEIKPSSRRRWSLQAVKALQAVHAVNVLHCNFIPCNLLLDANLDLYVCGFAGSSIDGAENRHGPCSKYTPPGKAFASPEKATELFALGSTLYFIMTGTSPHEGLDEDEVEKLFMDKKYPDLSGIECGPAILGCWEGTLTDADQVLDVLETLYGEEKV